MIEFWEEWHDPHSNSPCVTKLKIIYDSVLLFFASYLKTEKIKLVLEQYSFLIVGSHRKGPFYAKNETLLKNKSLSCCTILDELVRINDCYRCFCIMIDKCLKFMSSFDDFFKHSWKIDKFKVKKSSHATNILHMLKKTIQACIRLIAPVISFCLFAHSGICVSY